MKNASVKTLILMRHAKSAWPEGVDDFDRPLNERGLRDAPRMAKALLESVQKPDLVLVSPAKRTQQTYGLMGDFLADVTKRDEMGIYESSANVLLHLIHKQKDDVNTLMLIGHNTGTEVLALGLCEAKSVDAYPHMRIGFPTAAVAVMQFEGQSWRNLQAQSATLMCFLTPKTLKDGFSG